jgi:lambda family phage minor tail protein L
MSIAAELQSLNPSAKLEFFVIDATQQGAEEVLRFHNGTNKLSQPVVWQGHTYNPAAIEAAGFELRGDGPRPRPTLAVGDVFGVMGALVRQHDQLAGAKLLRKRTHARYLDAVNFAGGVNPSADATAQYADELWVFDRIRQRDGSVIVWELVSPVDLEDVLLPARQVRNTTCGSGYRTPECGYAGGPVATVDDVPTSSSALDECSRTVAGCKLRFGANAELPIDIFPGAGLVRQL